jgi:hypothetical protein
MARESGPQHAPKGDRNESSPAAEEPASRRAAGARRESVAGLSALLGERFLVADEGGDEWLAQAQFAALLGRAVDLLHDALAAAVARIARSGDSLPAERLRALLPALGPRAGDAALRRYLLQDLPYSPRRLRAVAQELGLPVDADVELVVAVRNLLEQRSGWIDEGFAGRFESLAGCGFYPRIDDGRIVPDEAATRCQLELIAARIARLDRPTGRAG